MKSKVFVSNTPFTGGKRFGKIWYIAKNSIESDSKILILSGYVVNKECDTLELILDKFEKEGFEGLNNLQGEYCIIVYDKITDLLYATNDLFGDGLMYYYQNGDDLVLSNDFWRMVGQIKPNYEMMDIDAICRFAVYGETMHTSTIIKGIYGLNFGSNNIFDLKKQTHCESKYNQYDGFEPQEQTIEEAGEQFNKAILASRDYVMKKYPGKRLSISISGGLDSRFMPAIYGKDHDYFVIVGDSHIHGFLKPYNFGYIDKIGKAYGIKIKKVNCTHTHLSRKIFLDIQNRPNSTQSFSKIIDKKEVDSDILIYGGGKTLLTSYRNKFMHGWNFYDLAEKYEGYRYIKEYPHSNKLKRLWNRMMNNKNAFQADPKLIDFYPIKIFKQEDFYTRSHRFIDAITHSDEGEKSIMYFRYDTGLEMKNGAFESLSGQIEESFSYYYPWSVRALRHLPNNLVDDRMLLKYVIDTYYPEVSKIASEHSIVGIHDERKISSFAILKAMLLKKIRGESGRDLSPAQKQEAFQLFNSTNSSWYDRIFDKEMVVSVYSKDLQIFLIHLKILLILSTIEKGEWDNYIE